LVQTVTDIKCLLYSDDLILCYSAPKKNFQKNAQKRTESPQTKKNAKERTESALRCALKLLANWCDNNGMVIKTAKTAFQTFSLPRHSINTLLRYKDTTPERTNEFTYLEMSFNTKLTWKSHINKIAERVSNRWNVLKRLAGSVWDFARSTLNTTCKMFIQSIKLYLFVSNGRLTSILLASHVMAESQQTLYEAITRNDIDSVRFQLANNVNPNVFPNNPTITPLILAVGLKFLDIANELLMNGADVNGVDEFGRTALHAAVDNNDEASVSILISHNCNLEKYNNGGVTPLTLAVEKNNIHMVRYLVANGAVVYKYLEGPEIPPLPFAASANRLDILQFLVNVEETDREKKKMNMNFALCLAINDGHNEAAIFLINNGAPISRRQGNCLTPLEFAIIGRNEYMVSYLLSRNASVSDTNHHGFTPLMTSIIFNNSYAAAQLLCYGADPDALATGFRTTGEQVAMDMRRVEIAQIISAWKNEFMPSMFEACTESNVYKYLEGPELPPLPFAAIVGRFDILQETDREKKKLNMNVALFLAIYNGHNDWIELKCCAGSVCEGDDADDDDDDDEIADVRGMLENTMSAMQQTLYEAITRNDIDSVRIQLTNNL
uniref:ANK_REP_REGION domain-containing protein n=1 Tax=Rodentolepis nana TaxID=102285 RepID=A0A0R3TRA2_RODNA